MGRRFRRRALHASRKLHLRERDRPHPPRVRHPQTDGHRRAARARRRKRRDARSNRVGAPARERRCVVSGRVRVFIGCSLDGFIAGPNDDLSWLPPPVEGDDHGYAAVFAGVGALLMGRRTHDAVTTFGSWPYEDRPVLVATRRPLTPKVPTARPVQGPITDLVVEARAAAQGRDVYVDGGDVIRQALDADLIDALTVTIVPVILGA